MAILRYRERCLSAYRNRRERSNDYHSDNGYPGNQYNINSPLYPGFDPFSTVPIQLTEPWTEYVTLTGSVKTATVLTNPPWSGTGSATASDWQHIIADNKLAPNLFNAADTFIGGISSTLTTRDHVDFQKKLQTTFKLQFIHDAVNNAAENMVVTFAITNSVTRTAVIIEGKLTGNSGAFWTWTEDFSIQTFKIRMYGNNSGGAGFIKVEYVRNGIVLGSDTVANSPGEAAGGWLQFNPSFRSRPTTLPVSLFQVILQYFTH